MKFKEIVSTKIGTKEWLLSKYNNEADILTLVMEDGMKQFITCEYFDSLTMHSTEVCTVEMQEYIEKIAFEHIKKLIKAVEG